MQGCVAVYRRHRPWSGGRDEDTPQMDDAARQRLEAETRYDPASVEPAMFARWRETGAFDVEPDDPGEPFVIVIPPPNVTGVLTMGHVLNNTLQDILIRRARLEGREALWSAARTTRASPRRRGRARTAQGEENRRATISAGKNSSRKSGRGARKRAASSSSSCSRSALPRDWRRTQFTMDPAYSQAVLGVFVDLFQQGHIYRGKRMVNWCPATLTALSDEEVIMKPVNGTIYQVRYERIDAPGQFIEVKTTRPETIPGDVAIAVHPDDPRYAAWIGKKRASAARRARNPDHRRRGRRQGIRLRRAQDHAGARQGGFRDRPAPQAAPIDVLTPDGKLNELAGPELAGLDRFAGRKKAAELLKERGRLVKEEPYETTSAIPSAPTCRSSRA